jgi:hypothetical protein
METTAIQLTTVATGPDHATNDDDGVAFLTFPSSAASIFRESSATLTIVNAEVLREYPDHCGAVER